MGLISMAKSSVTGVVQEQILEYFYADSLSDDVLVIKAKKKTKNGKVENGGNDNIISKGSVIVVNEGQCMLIVQQGEVIELCAQAGEFIFDSSTEPSIFYGNLGENIVNSFKLIAKRFTFGGFEAKDQRVYFFNTKEIKNNLFGTASPMPFKIVDPEINLSLQVQLSFHGIFTFKIIDPLLFYKNVTGNVTDTYTKSDSGLMSILKAEFIDAFRPVLSRVSKQNIMPDELGAYCEEITEYIREVLQEKWSDTRGIEVASIALGTIDIPEKSREKIEEIQMLRSRKLTGLIDDEVRLGQVEAMKLAGSNEGGSMNGFLGVGMASMFGGMTNPMQPGYAQPGYVQPGYMQQPMQQQPMQQQPMQQQPMQQQPMQQQPMQQPEPEQVPHMQAPIIGWLCSCGAKDNNGKFCSTCGTPKPAEAGWTCSCSKVNQGQFCSECGSKKPAGASIYKCDKCNWEPEDPAKPPKFCPECGDPFDDGDIVN